MADLCYILRVLSWTLFRCGLDLISMVFSVFVIRLMASGSDLIWVMYVVCLNLLLTELLLGMFHVIWCSWSYAWLMEVKFWGLLFKTPITQSRICCSLWLCPGMMYGVLYIVGCVVTLDHLGGGFADEV